MRGNSMIPSSITKPALFVGILIVLACFAYIQGGSSSSSNRIGKVQRETFEQRVTIAGKVEPVRSTSIAAPYDGYVKKLYVKLGQKVRVGDPIVSVVQSLQVDENVFPIRAPFTGTVTQLRKREGEFAKGAVDDYILRLDDTSKMDVFAYAPEIDIVKIHEGLEAQIRVSAVLSKIYRGVVRDIFKAATVKEQWGSRSQSEYLVVIEILDADSLLMPGMTAIADIITYKKENALTLRHEFIGKENDSFFVTLKGGTRREIKVGMHNESVFEVTEGLNEGDEVEQIDFLNLIENEQ